MKGRRLQLQELRRLLLLLLLLLLLPLLPPFAAPKKVLPPQLVQPLRWRRW
jgi:hypothetical protein